MFRLGNARYHNEWKNRQDVFNDFFPEWKQNNEEDMKTFPEDSAILFASYVHEGYEGDAVLLFVREGTMYLVTGAHCSCNGLEEYYDPEPTTWVELWQHHQLKNDSWSGHGTRAAEAWNTMIGHNITSLVEIIGEDDNGDLTVTRKLSGSGKRYMLVPEEFIKKEEE